MTAHRTTGHTLVLVAAALAVAGVRLWATRRAEFPFIVADEPAYLSMADLMAGRGGWSLGRSAVHGPAYSLLMAPWSSMGWSPDAVYRAAILINVAVAVGSFLVLERLVRRLTPLERPWTDWGTHSRRMVPADSARIVGALVLVSFAASVGFMAGRDRADQLVYGRYNDAFVALLVALGLGHLASRWPVRRMALEGLVITGATAAGGALIWWRRGELLRTPPNGITIRSLLALGPGNTRMVPHHTLVASIVVAAVASAALLVRRRPEALLVGVAALAAVGLHRGLADTTGPRPGDPRSAAAIDALVDPDDRVAYLLEPGRTVGGFFRYPFYAEDLRMYRISAQVWLQQVPWIMAPPARVEMAAAGYDLVWADPNGSNGLWHLAGS